MGADFKSVMEHVKAVITTKYYCFDGRTASGILPTAGITCRRLHDVGKSGWLQLLALILVIGVLIVLFLCIPAGSGESNQYGAANK